MDIEDRLDLIVKRLGRLRQHWEKRFRKKGMLRNPWQPNPPLTDDDIRRFERARGVELPGQYRAFLRIVGNGGVGPHYGLVPLQQTYTPCDGVIGRPFQPQLWNAEMWSRWDEEILPEDLSPWNGTLWIAEIGCGYGCLLIVTGEHRGYVWLDYIAGSGGFVATGKEFLDWYEGAE